MSHNRTIAVVVAAASLCLSAAALAFNVMTWLNDAAVRDFTDKDWELAWGTVQEALNSAEDGQTLTWENPDSGAHGSSTPSDTVNKYDTVCRQLTMVNNARHQQGESTIEYCRKPDGTWGIPTPPPPPRP